MKRSETMAEKTSVPVKAGDGWLRRWEPTDMIGTIRDEMERLWGQALPWSHARSPRQPAPAMTAWAPRMDVFEKDGSLVVKAELPGIKKEDVQVTLEQGDLLIRGERKTESEVKEQDYYRCERSYGSFYRRMPLPADVKPEQIQASFADGVLEVRLPMPATAKPEPTKIKVS
jgi:HSP20 family protein